MGMWYDWWWGVWWDLSRDQPTSGPLARIIWVVSIRNQAYWGCGGTGCAESFSARKAWGVGIDKLSLSLYIYIYIYTHIHTYMHTCMHKYRYTQTGETRDFPFGGCLERRIRRIDQSQWTWFSKPWGTFQATDGGTKASAGSINVHPQMRTWTKAWH